MKPSTHPDTDAIFSHLAAPDPAIEAHLDTCPRCAAEVAGLRRAMGELAEGAPPPLPQEQADDLVRQAMAAAGQPARAPRRWRGVGALALAALLFLGLLAWPRPRTIEAEVWDRDAGTLLYRAMAGDHLVPGAIAVVLRVARAVELTVEPGASLEVKELAPTACTFFLEPGAFDYQTEADTRLRLESAQGAVVVEAGSGAVRITEEQTRVEVRSGSARAEHGATALAGGVLLLERGHATLGDKERAAPEVEDHAEPEVERGAAPPPRPTPGAEPDTHSEPPLAGRPEAPPSPEALYAAAEQALARHDDAEAIRLFLDLAARAPEAPQGQLALFEAGRLLEASDPSAAADAYRRYLARGAVPLRVQAQAALCRLEPGSCEAGGP